MANKELVYLSDVRRAILRFEPEAAYILNGVRKVDAVEVVHGRWIWSEENECFVCSNCEMSALNNYRGNSTESNYCPNCGAKMMPQPPKGE